MSPLKQNETFGLSFSHRKTEMDFLGTVPALIRSDQKKIKYNKISDTSLLVILSFRKIASNHTCHFQ